MGKRLVSVLLDTHALLWWVSDSKRLSGSARNLIADESNQILVSAASAWEIATKFRIGKLQIHNSSMLDITSFIGRQGFTELAISVADGEWAGRLPGPHRDPFDRMLAAQALARKIPVVSVDAVFDSFGVVRLW